MGTKQFELSEEAAVRRAVEELGRLDILVNSPDLPFAKPLADTTPDEWQRVLTANLSAVFFACRAAGAVMLAQGKGRGEAGRGPPGNALPLRRLARSEEMAGLALYLASDASEFVTGQTIFVE